MDPEEMPEATLEETIEYQHDEVKALFEELKKHIDEKVSSLTKEINTLKTLLKSKSK